MGTMHEDAGAAQALVSAEAQDSDAFPLVDDLDCEEKIRTGEKADDRVDAVPGEYCGLKSGEHANDEDCDTDGAVLAESFHGYLLFLPASD